MNTAGNSNHLGKAYPRVVDVRVADNPDEGRFELFADGELAGSTYYRMEGGAIAFTHTEVDDRYEGQGLGSKLASAALDEVRTRGLSVLPYCPFIRGYIERHPDYLDLVPERDRARFGLRDRASRESAS